MFRTSPPKPKYQEKVELFFSCENLKNMDFFSLTDPQIRVYAQVDGIDVLLGETEVISNNLNPKFSKSIVMSYVFEAKQPLHFQIVDVDEPGKYNLVGDVHTSLGAIVGSRGQSATFQIANNSKSYGDLVVTAEKVGETAWTAYFQIQGESLENQHGWFLTSSPYFKLIKEAGQGTETLVTYESESVRGCLSPRWAPLEISLSKLCNGDRKKQIVLQVYTRRVFKEVLIGQCSFTVEDLLKQEMNLFWLSKIDGAQQDCGTIRIKRFEVFEKLDFLDYLKAGVQLNMMVAIDFTASNGWPDSPASLHAINSNGQLNQYQKAVQGVGEILLCYDYDQRVSVYGFGGVPSGDKFGDASHCFALSGNERQPYVIGLRQVMGLYENALKKVQLSGPTHFAKIMEESIRKARYNKENGSAEYLVLLILTDGVIHDMDTTINCLIEAAYLPLSVIIVGIGSADFSQMEILDGDKGLYNKNGLIVERDLVQFVPFDKFKGNKDRLASEVLQEIPMQLARYMNDCKISLMRGKEEELDELGTVSGSQNSVQDPDLYKYAPPITEMEKIMQTEVEEEEYKKVNDGNGIMNEVMDENTIGEGNDEVEIEK